MMSFRLRQNMSASGGSSEPGYDKMGTNAMPSVEFYLRKADECVIAAKAATLNEERARHYALAELTPFLAARTLRQGNRVFAPRERL
jgi:hypothetical protein